MSNPSGIIPKGPRILVKPHEVDKTFVKGGAIVMAPTEHQRETLGDTNGTVVAIGNGCFTETDGPWCAPGDDIIFAKYAGLLQTGADGVEYRLIRDIDVIAVRSKP